MAFGVANNEPPNPADQKGKVALSAQTLKVPFLWKAIAFVMAVISLSWFFEGWREINREPGLRSFSILFLGTGLTLFLLCLQAYWMYVEEKAKGTLRRHIALFDKLSDRFHKEAGAVSDPGGE